MLLRVGFCSWGSSKKQFLCYADRPDKYEANLKISDGHFLYLFIRAQYQNELSLAMIYFEHRPVLKGGKI